MWFKLLLICAALVDTAVGLQYQQSVIKCDSIFCQDAHLNAPCPTKRNCTTQGNRRYLTPELCNCCPETFCIQYSKEGEECDLGTMPVEVDLCGPQLTCPEATKKCSKITTGCMLESNQYDQSFNDGTLGTAQFKPSCDAVGKYANQQCLPGSLCYCSDLDGNRIFGIGLPNVPMNCKCSRDVANLRATSSFGGVMPRCLPNGDYDPMQCVGRDCWCMFRPSEKTRITALENLFCYDETLHPLKPSPYLRPCQHAKAQLDLGIIQARNESTVILAPDTPVCDLDGNYSPVQSRHSKLICVDHNGHSLRNYGIEKTSPLASKVDCFCARVEKLLEGNVNGKPTCCKHGNFRKWQCSGSICYCVDKDGKQIVNAGSDLNEVHKDDVAQLKCYQSTGDDCVY